MKNASNHNTNNQATQSDGESSMMINVLPESYLEKMEFGTMKKNAFKLESHKRVLKQLNTSLQDLRKKREIGT